MSLHIKRLLLLSIGVLFAMNDGNKLPATGSSCRFSSVRVFSESFDSSLSNISSLGKLIIVFRLFITVLMYTSSLTPSKPDSAEMMIGTSPFVIAAGASAMFPESGDGGTDVIMDDKCHL